MILCSKISKESRAKFFLGLGARIDMETDHWPRAESLKRFHPKSFDYQLPTKSQVIGLLLLSHVQTSVTYKSVSSFT